VTSIFRALYERPRTAIDISIADLSQAPVAPRPVRHLVEQPNGDTPLCGYKPALLDIVDTPAGTYADPHAGDCPDCARERRNREAA
jgi:hypothetical protein